MMKVDSSQTTSREVNKSLSVAKPEIGSVSSIASATFAAVTFPTRYIGAKSWSIPGLVMRTPLILFKRLFWQQPLTAAQFLGTGYRSRFEGQLTQDQTKEMLRYASYGLLPFRYEEDKWAQPYGARIINPTTLNVDVKKLPGKVQATDKTFIDKETLFKAVIVEDDHELVVAFGSMHSHWHDFSDSSLAKKQYHNQLGSVFTSFAGYLPPYYEQADALVEQLKKVAETKNKRFVVTGQSLAGSLASYVSLKQGVRGVCINAVQLGAGVQQSIGDAKLAKADQYLIHVTIDNEILSALPGLSIVDYGLSGLGVRTPGNFGRRFTIPSAFKSWRASHDYPIQSMMQYIGYNKEDKASNLKHIDIIKSR
jgi:hypothetical protein